MQIYQGIDELPSDYSCVLTIGIFDGVHRGHRTVLQTLTERARARGVRAAVVTFVPHPLQIHEPDNHLELIMPVSDRLDALAAAGVETTVIIDYNLEFASQTPREFVQRYFVQSLGAREIVVGTDVRFGQNNQGDLKTLMQLGEELGFAVVTVSDLTSPLGRRWSSTWIRQALAEGDVAQAAYVLGKPHRIAGRVIRGYKRGRELGFPTANLDARDCGVVPEDGVYAGWLVRRVQGTPAVEHLPSAISVGTNPQFSGTKRTVEAHVLGRSDLNLYDEEVTIQFIERLRGMQKFATLEGLLVQMDADLRQCAQVLGVPVAGRQDPTKVTAH